PDALHPFLRDIIIGVLPPPLSRCHDTIHEVGGIGADARPVIGRLQLFRDAFERPLLPASLDAVSRPESVPPVAELKFDSHVQGVVSLEFPDRAVVPLLRARSMRSHLRVRSEVRRHSVSPVSLSSLHLRWCLIERDP